MELNEVMMMAQNPITVRFYQSISVRGLPAQYLMQIRKRRHMIGEWNRQQYQTRGHLGMCYKRWIQQQIRLWIDGPEGEDMYHGLETVMKKPKIALLMSLVFAEETCSQALLDFLFHIDVGRISRVVEEPEN